jgi:hypothetical protein
MVWIGWPRNGVGGDCGSEGEDGGRGVSVGVVADVGAR